MKKILRFLAYPNNAARTAIIVGFIMLVEFITIIVLRIIGDHQVSLTIMNILFICGVFFELGLRLTWSFVFDNIVDPKYEEEFYTDLKEFPREVRKYFKDGGFKEDISMFDWEDVGTAWTALIMTAILWVILTIAGGFWIGLVFIGIHVLVGIVSIFVALFNHDFS